MGHRLLIIVADMVERVRLRGEFAQAGYKVCVSASLDHLPADIPRPHAVILGHQDRPSDALKTLSARLPADRGAPMVIGFGDAEPDYRLAAIGAGFADVVADLRLLRARLRDVLRAEEAISEAARRRSAARMLGMAEPRADFAPCSRITLVGPVPMDIEAAAAKRANWQVRRCRGDAVLSERSASDVYVLGASAAADTLLPELRARDHSRHAVILVLYDTEGTGDAAHALDARATDVAPFRASGEEVAIRLERALLRKASDDALRRQEEATFELAMRDPLTGLYNRRYAEAYLAQTLENAEVSADIYAAMIIDLDGFKSINDLHGHAKGDEVIRAVAASLRDDLRATDMVARIGGDEFLLVMPQTTPEEADRAAERLRRRVSEIRVDSRRGSIAPTLSIGVAVRPRRQGSIRSPEALLAAADAALYVAKSAGRNCVRLNAGIA